MSLLCQCVTKHFWERTDAANRYIAAYKKYYGPAAAVLLTAALCSFAVLHWRCKQ